MRNENESKFKWFSVFEWNQPINPAFWGISVGIKSYLRGVYQDFCNLFQIIISLNKKIEFSIPKTNSQSILGKTRRLKQAKDEATEEIEKYRQERERQFKDFEAQVGEIKTKNYSEINLPVNHSFCSACRLSRRCCQSNW